MDFLTDISSYLDAHAGTFLLSLFIIALLALILSLILAIRWASMTRPLSRFRSKEAPETVIPSIIHSIEENQQYIKDTASDLSGLREESRSFLRHSALVRYDAFNDIGGQQSFSLCLLDADKNGYLLTYLTGRDSTRSYAVQVRGGEPSRKLSEEELRAYNEALSSRGDG